MPRSVATVVENNFVKGLITEATGLQYPENSVVDTSDCIFDVLGAVQRRLGFDYEYGYSTTAFNKTGSAINTYQWKNVTGDGLISFLVVQIGSTLRFYSSTDGATSLSGNLMASSINLLTYQASGSANPAQYECQFADGLSKLYVVHPCLDNFYVTYDTGTAAFTATPYTLTVRDFEGVPDGLAVDQRPATLGTNDNHRYNLYNQGWDAGKITTFQAAASAYPSNADVWWIYKDLTDTFNPATTLANNYRGTTKAPPAHYLLSLYTGSRDTASGLSGIAASPSNSARTSAVAFFAGRVWYSGIATAKFNSKIYFTQIIQSDTQVGSCYQACDPTNESLFDLLPDDGGVISIPEAGTIYKMVPVQNSLLIFAYRGIWQISGSTGLGFTATDMVVSRLSSVRSGSACSYVDVNGLPIFWNTDGIWAIQPTKDGTGLQVNPVSRNTIQTFYDDIPTASKLFARGYFNPLDQIVSWIYSSVPPTDPDSQFTFDRVLNFNILTGAFYPWIISPGVNVHAIVVIDGTGGISLEEQIIDNASENVVTDAGEFVVGYSLTNLSVAPKTKFLTSVPAGGSFNFTFSENNNSAYEDWVTVGTATVYESYFITGYKLHGQANKDFQANYVTVYNEGTGVVYVQGVWDFSISTDNGRYTAKQICRYEDDSYKNAYKRLKIRGQGKSLQFKISSLEGNDFNVIGWSAWETSNTAP